MPIKAEKPTISTNRVIAFAGIGRPQKFYNTLQELSLEIVDTIDFPDHHYYSEAELQQILEKAKKNKAQAITTSKDFVKIPDSLKNQFSVLNIGIQWENPSQLQNFILSYLKQK